MRAIGLGRLVTVLALVAMLLPAAAGADGDPASDVLLGENVFYPYMPPVTAAVQQKLDAEAVAAKRAGFPIKVALIASPIDLGVIPILFNHPQKYADFLDQEISFEGKQPLLVVMPAGYGVQGFAASAMSAVSTLAPPAGKTSTDLAQAAITAVARLAKAAAHEIPPVSGPGRRAVTAGGGSTAPIAGALGVGAVLIAGTLIALRRRQAARTSRRVSSRR